MGLARVVGRGLRVMVREGVGRRRKGLLEGFAGVFGLDAVSLFVGRVRIRMVLLLVLVLVFFLIHYFYKIEAVAVITYMNIKITYDKYNAIISNLTTFDLVSESLNHPTITLSQTHTNTYSLYSSPPSCSPRSKSSSTQCTHPPPTLPPPSP